MCKIVKIGLALCACVGWALAGIAQPSVTFPAFRETNMVISVAPPEQPTNAPSSRETQGFRVFEKQTGFFGQTFWAANVTNAVAKADHARIPIRSELLIYDHDGVLVDHIKSNPVGQFYAFVSPGAYTVVATLPGVALTVANLDEIAALSRTDSTILVTRIAVITNQLIQANTFIFRPK